MWDINANLHYLFDIAPKTKVYPLVGLGYTNWNVELELLDHETIKATKEKLAVNVGAGIQYELTNKVNVDAEVKYQIIDNYNQVVVGVGLAYKF